MPFQLIVPVGVSPILFSTRTNLQAEDTKRPFRLILHQTRKGEGTCTEYQPMQLSTCWIIWWAREASHVKKINHSGVVKIAVNNTEWSQRLVQKRCHNAAAVTWDYRRSRFPQIFKRWVIKRVKTYLSNEDIKTYLKNERFSLNINSAERIVSRSNASSTVAVITSERNEMPATVHWDQRPQTPKP